MCESCSKCPGSSVSRAPEFNLNIAGQNFTYGSASYTTAPTLLFEYGEFVGVSFELDTSAAPGFAYSSLAMSGLDVTAIVAGTGQQLFTAAAKRQTMASLDFTNTYTTDAVNITVKVTFADGSTKQEIVLVPASSDAVTVRAFIWSTLDDMEGVKAVLDAGNRLEVKGTDKLLKSIEFTAGKDNLNRDPGIVYLKAKVLGTADVTPVVKVNGTEVPK